MQTTLQTVDFSRSGVMRQDLPGLNQNNILPLENLKESNKAKESEFCASPIEQSCPNLGIHSIEASTKTLEHGSFGKEKNLIPELMEKKNAIIILPANGMHVDTPLNQHLTNHFSQESNAWPAPLQRQEKLTNIYDRKTSHFIAQFNLNPFDLCVDIVLGQPISQFGLTIGRSIGGFHQTSGLTTANFNDKTDDPNPLVNMNNVFTPEDSSDN